MSQFGNRVPGLVPAPNVTPDVSQSVGFENAQRVLGGLLGAGQVVAETVAKDKQRQMQVKEISQKEQLGEEEVSQAVQHMELYKARQEEIQLRFGVDAQKAKAKDLVDLEWFGAQKIIADKTPEEASRFFAAHPFMDPQNEERAARAVGGALAQPAITEMFQEIVKSVQQDTPISVAGWISNKIDSMGGVLAGAHPETVNTMKEKLLQEGEGFLRGQLNNKMAAEQAEVTRNVADQGFQALALSRLGEISPESRDKTLDDLYKLVPHGSEQGKAHAIATAIGKITTEALGNPIPSNDPTNMLKWLGSFTGPVAKEIKAMGIGEHVQAAILKKEQTDQAAMITDLSNQLTQAGRADNIVALEGMRGQINLLPEGPKRTTLNMKLEAELVNIKTTDQAQAAIGRVFTGADKLNDRQFPDRATSKYFDTMAQKSDAVQVMKSFVEHGMPLPSSAVHNLDAMWNQNPVQAMKAVAEIDEADHDVSRGLARKLDKDGFLWAGVRLMRGVPEDSPERQKIVSLLSNPQARAMAPTILKSMEKIDAYSAIKHANTTGMSAPTLTGDTVSLYEAAYNYRFIEAMAQGVQKPEDAAERAKKAAIEDTADRTVPVVTKMRGGILPYSATTMISSDLFGIGTSLHPNQQAFDTFTNAVNDFSSDHSWGARPELGFRIGNTSYVPALRNGTPIGFMMWNNGKGHAIGPSDGGFGDLAKRFMGHANPDDLGDMAPLRRRPEYGVLTPFAYDAKFNSGQMEGGMRERIMKAARKAWDDRGWGPPTETDRGDFRSEAERIMRQAGWFGWGEDGEPATK